MTSYLLEVRNQEQVVLMQGTGWLLSPNIVVTAFHVVGAKATRKWWHLGPDADANYYLRVGTEQIQLEPLESDADADVAILRLGLSAATPVVLKLAGGIPLGEARWRGVGFPGFHNRKPFGLTGLVVHQFVNDHSRSLQLTLDQSTQVSWEGISGCPVCINNDEVIGTVTEVSNNTNTGWASSLESVVRLVLKIKDAARSDAAISTIIIPSLPDFSRDIQGERAALKSLKLKFKEHNNRSIDHLISSGKYEPKLYVPRTASKNLTQFAEAPIRDREKAIKRLIEIFQGLENIHPLIKPDITEIVASPNPDFFDKMRSTELRFATEVTTAVHGSIKRQLPIFYEIFKKLDAKLKESTALTIGEFFYFYEKFDELMKQLSKKQQRYIITSDIGIIINTFRCRTIYGLLLTRVNEYNEKLHNGTVHTVSAVLRRTLKRNPLAAPFLRVTNHLTRNLSTLPSEERACMSSSLMLEIGSELSSEHSQLQNLVSNFFALCTDFKKAIFYLEPAIQLFQDLSQGSKQLFTVIDRAGAGKTNLLCNLAETHSFSLFFEGRDPDLLRRSGLELSVLEIIWSIFPHAQWTDIDQLLAKESICLIVMVDAINECSEIDGLTTSISKFLEHTLGRRIRLIITCRDIYSSFFPLESWSEYKAGNLQYALYQYSEHEYKIAINNYFERYNIDAELAGDAYEQCKHPLLLTFFCITYSQQKNNSQIHHLGKVHEIRLKKLFDTYWEKKLENVRHRTKMRTPQSYGNFLMQICRLMIKKARNTLVKEEIAELSSILLDAPNSVYTQILDENILLEEHSPRNKLDSTRIVFVYEAFMEYVMARALSLDGAANELPLVWLRRVFAELQNCPNRNGVLEYALLFCHDNFRMSIWQFASSAFGIHSGPILSALSQLEPDHLGEEEILLAVELARRKQKGLYSIYRFARKKFGLTRNSQKSVFQCLSDSKYSVDLGITQKVASSVIFHFNVLNYGLVSLIRLARRINDLQVRISVDLIRNANVEIFSTVLSAFEPATRPVVINSVASMKYDPSDVEAILERFLGDADEGLRITTLAEMAENGLILTSRLVRLVTEDTGSWMLEFLLGLNGITPILNETGAQELRQRIQIFLNSLPIGQPDSSEHWHIYRKARKKWPAIAPPSISASIDETDLVCDEDPLRSLIKEELSSNVRRVLATLTPREEKIIRNRIFDEDRVRHIAQAYNVSESLIYKIFSSAIRKLRHPFRARLLAPYFDE